MQELTEHQKNLIQMSDEDYDRYMVETYPILFKNRHLSPQVTCMCWGFDIPSGWRHILDFACKQLEEIRAKTGVECVFDQIKEKFWSARFYCHCENLPEGEAGKIWDHIVYIVVRSAEGRCSLVDMETEAPNAR